jgi:hypothetical protein
MNIEIGDYSFEGCFSSPKHLDDKPGLYAIFCINYGKNLLIDIGESKNIKTRIEDHERSSCWRRNCASALGYAALYTPKLKGKGRQKIEQEIRDEHNPICGRP